MTKISYLLICLALADPRAPIRKNYIPDNWNLTDKCILWLKYDDIKQEYWPLLDNPIRNPDHTDDYIFDPITYWSEQDIHDFWQDVWIPQIPTILRWHIQEYNLSVDPDRMNPIQKMGVFIHREKTLELYYILVGEGLIAKNERLGN